MLCPVQKWPSVDRLAAASIEVSLNCRPQSVGEVQCPFLLQEVMEVWSGLGYYSRAQRLWEAAKKVMNLVIKPQPSFLVISTPYKWSLHVSLIGLGLMLAVRGNRRGSPHSLALGKV